jgi:hypothetical protein
MRERDRMIRSRSIPLLGQAMPGPAHRPGPAQAIWLVSTLAHLPHTVPMSYC